MTSFYRGSEEFQALFPHQLEKKPPPNPKTIPLTLQIICSAAIQQQTTHIMQIIMQ